MKSNVRHTFRPALEALEDRLVPSWSMSGGIGAVLTAAQPAPALSSFQWGNGTVPSVWDIRANTGNAVVLTAAQPAAASPPAASVVFTDVLVTK
jgi:hypothetical protein